MNALLRLMIAAVFAFGLVHLPLLAENKVPEGTAKEAPKDERNPKALPPSEQPKSGPGGSDYAHKEVVVENRGEGGTEYWIYLPAAPSPKTAPVIVLLHGFGAMQPVGYLAWLEHLARRGNIVIYPRYQADIMEPPANFAPNAAKSVLDAFAFLEADKARPQPLKEKFALVGHSAGGATSANVAARHEELKLPKPLALMPIQPGVNLRYDRQGNSLIPLADYGKIPAGCLLACVYGDSDEVVGDYMSRKVFIEATSVAAKDKNLIRFRSDLYGSRPLVAGHYTPSAPKGEADVFDWYGYWKLFDGLTDAAFHGKNRQYALGDTPEQRFMGKFSDGRAVREKKITLGDAKLELDSGYSPEFDREGNKFELQKRRPALPPRREDPPADPPKAPAPEKPRDDR